MSGGRGLSAALPVPPNGAPEVRGALAATVRRPTVSSHPCPCLPCAPGAWGILSRKFPEKRVGLGLTRPFCLAVQGGEGVQVLQSGPAIVEGRADALTP